MSPENNFRGQKVVPSNNLYTIILAVAFAVVIATVGFVAYKCYFQYDTIFKMP